jgi:hypothetical protein
MKKIYAIIFLIDTLFLSNCQESEPKSIEITKHCFKGIDYIGSLDTIARKQDRLDTLDFKFYMVKNTFRQDPDSVKKSIYTMLLKETKYMPNSDLPQRWHINYYTFWRYSDDLAKICNNKYLTELSENACSRNAYIFSCRVYYYQSDTLINTFWYKDYDCEKHEDKTYKYKDFIKLCENITENTK